MTRAALVAEIDQRGTEAFIRDAVQAMEDSNPELLQMAHNFALEQENYAGIMQGFALLYAALLKQSAADRLTVH
jgi:acyl carrier protein phosphodiesterase